MQVFPKPLALPLSSALNLYRKGVLTPALEINSKDPALQLLPLACQFTHSKDFYSPIHRSVSSALEISSS